MSCMAQPCNHAHGWHVAAAHAAWFLVPPPMVGPQVAQIAVLCSVRRLIMPYLPHTFVVLLNRCSSLQLISSCSHRIQLTANKPNAHPCVRRHTMCAHACIIHQHLLSYLLEHSGPAGRA